MHLPLPKVLILPALLAALLLPLPAAAAPVSLHFVDADLATVLRAVARLGGYGLVLDGAVDGRVTIDTEAEPALFLPQLARMYGLAVEQQGTTFYISAASHRNAQRRPYVFPVRYGAPERLAAAVNLSFPAAGFEQKVTNSNSDTEKKENRPRTAAQSGGQGRVTCDADSQSLIFYGTPDEAEAVRELLRTLDVPARQVSLEAKVVSLSKDASRELGVEWNWSALPQTPEVSESWETRRHITTTADGKRVTEYEDLPKREVRRTFRGGSAIPGILQFGRGPEGYPFEFYYEANLHALVSEGKAKLLSRPNVTTLTGLEAVIEIGGEVPVPTTETTDRATTTSFTYQKAGIILRYTPWVSDDGSITALVHTEVSSPLYVADLKAYRFQKRSADTTVRLRDGETMVIGGLIGSEEARSLSKIPFLGDLPVLGAFFRNERKSKEDSEIMMFLTAHVLPETAPDKGER